MKYRHIKCEICKKDIIKNKDRHLWGGLKEKELVWLCNDCLLKEIRK